MIKLNIKTIHWKLYSSKATPETFRFCLSYTWELFQGVHFKSWVAKTNQTIVTWAKYGLEPNMDGNRKKKGV